MKKYFIYIILLIVLSCSNENKIQLLDRNGNVISYERRMPLYNRKMIEQSTSSTVQHKVENYHKQDDKGEKYYSTGKVETNPTPKAFKKLHSVAPHHNQKHDINEENKLNETEPLNTDFVDMSHINFNENKNATKTDAISLNKQNIMTQKEYKPSKNNTPKPIKKNTKTANKDKIAKEINQIKTIKTIPSKQQFNGQPKVKSLPIEDKNTKYNNLFFIKVTESDSVINISDDLKNIKYLSNYVVSIEKNNSTKNYELIIGPINNYADANLLHKTINNSGYKKSVIIEHES